MHIGDRGEGVRRALPSQARRTLARTTEEPENESAPCSYQTAQNATVAKSCLQDRMGKLSETDLSVVERALRVQVGL